MTRAPITVDGDWGSSTDPATWCTWAEAGRSTAGDGLGFVLGAGVGCIDLDDCLVDGVLADWAAGLLERMPATYIEVSPSGNGLHIWGLLPEGPGRKIRDGVRKVEVYSVGRYMTVTGVPFVGSVPTLADLSEVVASSLGVPDGSCG